jgi:predicted transcriptional regulator
LIESQVNPVKVAVIEALHWVGGPLSAHEVWLMGVGAELSTVAYHVKTLVDLGILTHVAEAPVRGSLEKFHVLTPAI